MRTSSDNSLRQELVWDSNDCLRDSMDDATLVMSDESEELLHLEEKSLVMDRP
jgi:hypothetical protein